MAAVSLVIVESPAKARTIAGFLGKDFAVESSIGHIRDLPRRADDIPANLKKAPWARLGVDVDHDFKPLYIISPDKKHQIDKLKSLLAGAKELFLATDEDREGEAIAWHLLEVLKPKVPVKRMVFHEITKAAIQDAIDHPRDIDRRLVDAQEARRILDRLYGYEVSPVLWKKVGKDTSAGRVQSVATRIIVERERARMRFVKAAYFDVDATLEHAGQRFSATLLEVDGKRLATSKDFDEKGVLGKDVVRLDFEKATAIASELAGVPLNVAQVERRPNKRSPAAPFMTSTLQQEAGRKLRFASARTMRSAQKLYEAGYITYMRTDSTILSQSALASARTQIEKMYGREYLPAEPRTYAKKVKNAQEAHEAIRPSGDVFRLPEEVAREVGPDEAKLYELIWMRTIASQMKDSLGESVQVRLEGLAANGRKTTFAASGHTVTFPGFLRAYVEGSDDPSAEIESRERPLPPLTEGLKLIAEMFEAKAHETQPPARFTEASLVQKLEELGVGRPSTYAAIISTIMDRGYVWKKGSALVPTFLAFSVVQLLEQHFDNLVDYAFTAKMEDELDAIAAGEEHSVPWLSRFYFGSEANGQTPENPGLKSMVADRLGEIDARAINTLSLGNDAEEREVVIRVGKYGPYLQRGESTAKIPPDVAPDELTLERASALLDAPSGDRELGVDAETGKPIFVRTGRFGAYVQLGDAGGEEKPKTSSLLKSMSYETLTLEDALRLLTQPRTVGTDPTTGEPITAQLGPKGPYMRRGTDTRSLETEEQVFDITVAEAVEVFAKPKVRQMRKAVEPLKLLGEDPVSKQPIKLLQGRFGLYVTDGETNASLRREDSLETISEDRAQELLQARRDAGPSKGKPKRAAKAKSETATKSKPSAKKAASKAKAPSAKKTPDTDPPSSGATKKAPDSKTRPKAKTSKSAAAPAKKAKKPASKG